MDEIKKIIKNLDDNEFKTPISVADDYLYYENLKEKYTKILDSFKRISDQSFRQELNEISQNILDAIQYYYSGNLKKACICIETIVKRFENNNLIVDDANCHFIFQWIIRGQKFEKDNINGRLDFYKARISEGVESFKADDMIHIPLKKRGLVSTQRFSIAGIPSMYLATSTYCCWKELGMPADNKFNVSHVTLKEIKLFNLAVNLGFLKDAIATDINFEGYSISSDEFIKDYLKLWLVNIACSYIVRETPRSFKSEYIVPQLIMLALKEINVDGVVYCSRKIDEKSYNLWGKCKNLNVAIMSKYQSEETTDLKENVNITDSVNYNEFKQLNLKGIKKKDDTNSDIWTDRLNGIQIAGEYHPYFETEFYNFEEYIKTLEN